MLSHRKRKKNPRKPEEMQVKRKSIQQEEPKTTRKLEEFDARKQKEGDQKKMQETETRKGEDASPELARKHLQHDELEGSPGKMRGQLRTPQRKDAVNS